MLMLMDVMVFRADAPGQAAAAGGRSNGSGGRPACAPRTDGMGHTPQGQAVRPRRATTRFAQSHSTPPTRRTPSSSLGSVHPVHTTQSLAAIPSPGTHALNSSPCRARRSDDQHRNAAVLKKKKTRAACKHVLELALPSLNLSELRILNILYLFVSLN